MARSLFQSVSQQSVRSPNPLDDLLQTGAHAPAPPPAPFSSVAYGRQRVRAPPSPPFLRISSPFSRFSLRPFLIRCCSLVLKLL